MLAIVSIQLLLLSLCNLFAIAISQAFPDADEMPMVQLLFSMLMYYFFYIYLDQMSMTQMLHKILPEMLMHCALIYSKRIAQPYDMLTITYAAFATVLAVTAILILFTILVNFFIQCNLLSEIQQTHLQIFLHTQKLPFK